MVTTEEFRTENSALWNVFMVGWCACVCVCVHVWVYVCACVPALGVLERIDCQLFCGKRQCGEDLRDKNNKGRDEAL